MTSTVVHVHITVVAAETCNSNVSYLYTYRAQNPPETNTTGKNPHNPNQTLSLVSGISVEGFYPDNLYTNVLPEKQEVKVI